MSKELRVALWNIFQENILISPYHDDKWHKTFKIIYREFLRWPTDEVSSVYNVELSKVKKWFFGTAEWYDIYNLYDFLLNNYKRFFLKDSLHKILIVVVNDVLEAENSGYRIINGILSPISNTVEVDEVSIASLENSNDKINIIHTHIRSALELLSKKPNPDYRNSIKESISAVEATVKIITNISGGGIKSAMSMLENDFPVHGAMKEGIIKLYGWTCNADGIRHGLLEESTVGFDEAKYMIVMCSAFVNYLISKASKLGKFAG